MSNYNDFTGKFGVIVSELRQRGIIMLMHRSVRSGYVIDAVIPSTKVVILKMPDLGRRHQLSMGMFLHRADRLEGDGYRVFIVPKNSMNEAQIKTFCDRISAKLPQKMSVSGFELARFLRPGENQPPGLDYAKAVNSDLLPLFHRLQLQ